MIPTLVAVRVAPRKAWDVDAVIGQQPDADAPTQAEGSDHAESRHQERGGAHLHHLAHRGLQAHFEQQDQHPDAGQEIHELVALHGVQELDPEVAKHHADHQLPKHTGLARPGGQVPAQFGREEDDHQGQGDERGRIVGVIPRGPCGCGRSEHADEDEGVSGESVHRRRQTVAQAWIFGWGEIGWTSPVGVF